MSRMKLESISDIFGEKNNFEADNAITEIEIDRLIPYKQHPFKLYDGKRLENMIESIKEFGVITPIIVRKNSSDKYEILSGHNRVNASKYAGLKTIPAIIKSDVTDDDAILIVTESNFLQRSLEDMLPSEKAKAFEMQMKILRKQGKRPDWFAVEEIKSKDIIKINATSTTGLSKWRSDEKVGEKNNLSREMVRKYIRLNHLNPFLLNLVDDKRINIKAAVEISYLNEKEQEKLINALSSFNYEINIRKSKMIRKQSELGKLTEEQLLKILSGKEKELKTTLNKTSFSLDYKIIRKHFESDHDKKAIEQIIDDALELYLGANESVFKER